jgi:hypothetical protein
VFHSTFYTAPDKVKIISDRKKTLQLILPEHIGGRKKFYIVDTIKAFKANATQ